MRFSAWKPWSTRPSYRDDMDVPLAFETFGIYLLAQGDLDPHLAGQSTARHLDKHVVFIGISRRIDQRLEERHQAVSAYLAGTDDVSCSNLRYG